MFTVQSFVSSLDLPPLISQFLGDLTLQHDPDC